MRRTRMSRLSRGFVYHIRRIAMFGQKKRLSLINRTYLDDCCPIGKRNRKQVGATPKNLIAPIKTYLHGTFEGFNVLLEAMRRGLSTSMKQQRKRNQTALLRSRLGGVRVHTYLETGVQYLLVCVKEERAIERGACET